MEPDGIANPQPATAEAGRPVPLSRVLFCKMLIFTLLLYNSDPNPRFSGLLLYNGKQNPRSSGSPLYNIMKKKRLCLLPFYIFVVILRLSKETSFFEITNRMSNNKM